MSGLVKGNGLVSNPVVLALASLHSPTVYVPIANLGDMVGPTRQRKTAVVTAHGNRAERIVSTLLAEGTVSGPIFFIPAAGQEPTHTDATNGVQAIFERGDLRSWAIFYKDAPGTAKFFNAYVTKLSEKEPVVGVVTMEFELSIDDVVSTGTEAGGAAAAVFAPPEV